jgi:hypothetical protein
MTAQEPLSMPSPKFGTAVDVYRYLLDGGTIASTDDKNPEIVRIVDNEFCRFYQGQWKKTPLHGTPQCWKPITQIPGIDYKMIKVSKELMKYSEELSKLSKELSKNKKSIPHGIVDIRIEIYSGCQPNDPNDEPTGELLIQGTVKDCQISQHDYYVEVLMNGTLPIIADGTLGWCRVYISKGGVEYGSFDSIISDTICDGRKKNNIRVKKDDKFLIKCAKFR